MWLTFAWRARDIHTCVRCVFAERVKRSKVWVHVTKISNTNVRCNKCSSVIVNKGGNISNVMKHLLTKHIYLKQCTVFTMSPVSSSNLRDTFTSNVDSAVELHSRDSLSLAFTCCSDMCLFRARALKHAYTKRLVKLHDYLVIVWLCY